MLNENLLKISISVGEYLREIKIIGEKVSLNEEKLYWDKLSKHVIAKCPFCGEIYTEAIDLYSLRFWVRPTSGGDTFRNYNIKRCNHFFVSQLFINLNQQIPDVSQSELRWRTQFNSEVPHVMPMLFDDKIESYAVMHSLPICRIEEDQFVPRYTLYMITYYTQEEHKELIMDRLRKREATLNNYEMLAFPLPEDGEATEWWDLKQWVDKGKLFWLEPDNPDLPLIKGPVGKFPCGEITGRKEPYFETVPPRRKKKLFGLFGG